MNIKRFALFFGIVVLQLSSVGCSGWCVREREGLVCPRAGTYAGRVTRLDGLRVILHDDGSFEEWYEGAASFRSGTGRIVRDSGVVRVRFAEALWGSPPRMSEIHEITGDAWTWPRDSTSGGGEFTYIHRIGP